MDKSILEVVYESARDLHKASLMDQATFEQFLVRHDIEADRMPTTEEARSQLLPDTD